MICAQCQHEIIYGVMYTRTLTAIFIREGIPDEEEIMDNEIICETCYEEGS